MALRNSIQKLSDFSSKIEINSKPNMAITSIVEMLMKEKSDPIIKDFCSSTFDNYLNEKPKDIHQTIFYQ